MEALRAMVEVHEGICGAHQPGLKMRWLLRKHNYYWPTMTKDCIEYAKGLSSLPKVWGLKTCPSKGFTFSNQTLAILRVGFRLDRQS